MARARRLTTALSSRRVARRACVGALARADPWWPSCAQYVPFVKDSKRAMDEYTSSIFMNGIQTIVMHNTCEDSLLAAYVEHAHTHHGGTVSLTVSA
jgi:hypothetical protein